MATKVLFREEFRHLPGKINWFPGHMRKAMKQLEDELKKVNLFIEVRDARIPVTSQNKELLALLPAQMNRVVVYNKMDLAQQKRSVELMKEIHSDNDPRTTYLHTSTKDGSNINKLLKLLAD